MDASSPRVLLSCRKSSTFTAVGQDERGQGIDSRGHLFQGISGQVVPGGTGTIGAAAEVIEAVMRGALAATGGVEHAFADGCKLF